jgi:hypothetical protein
MMVVQAYILFDIKTKNLKKRPAYDKFLLLLAYEIFFEYGKSSTRNSIPSSASEEDLSFRVERLYLQKWLNRLNPTRSHNPKRLKAVQEVPNSHYRPHHWPIPLPKQRKVNRPLCACGCKTPNGNRRFANCVCESSQTPLRWQCFATFHRQKRTESLHS